MVFQKFVVISRAHGSPSGRSALGGLDARRPRVLHTKAPLAPRPPGLRALRDSRCTLPCIKDLWDSTLPPPARHRLVRRFLRMPLAHDPRPGDLGGVNVVGISGSPSGTSKSRLLVDYALTRLP